MRRILQAWSITHLAAIIAGLSLEFISNWFAARSLSSVVSASTYGNWASYPLRISGFFVWAVILSEALLQVVLLARLIRYWRVRRMSRDFTLLWLSTVLCLPSVGITGCWYLSRAEGGASRSEEQ